MAQTVLLVVIDPTTHSQIALKRAEQLAADTDAHLHLFCCDYRQDLGEFTSRKDGKHEVLADTEQRLNVLAEPLRSKGLHVTTEAYWNAQWQESVVHACSRAGADMVIKSSLPHDNIQRHFKKTSDYTLLRKSPCAVLLVKSDAPWNQQRMLAAIAIDAEDGKHELLNNLIAREAHHLAQSTHSELHLVAALDQSPDMSDVLKLLDDDNDEHSNEQLLSRRFGIDVDRTHVQSGRAKNVILDVVEKINADVLVIGTVARTGLTATLLGNTAEKLLDSLEIDVLTVS